MLFFIYLLLLLLVVVVVVVVVVVIVVIVVVVVVVVAAAAADDDECSEYLFVLLRHISCKIRLVSQADPVRWKVVLVRKHREYDGAGSRPVAVVDRFRVIAGEPGRPPSVASRGQYQRIAGSQQRHVEGGRVAVRVHDARRGRPVTERRFQYRHDVRPGPGRVVGRHDVLDRGGDVGGEVVGGLDEVGWSGNGETVREVELSQDIASTNVDSDAQERTIPVVRSNFVQEPTNRGKLCSI